MTKKAVLTAVLLLLLALFVPSVGAANPPEPTYGTATIDGAIGEWDLDEDFFAVMWLAGDPNKKPAPQILSRLYLRYDCGAEVLNVLVLVEPGQQGLRDQLLAWIKAISTILQIIWML